MKRRTRFDGVCRGCEGVTLCLEGDDELKADGSCSSIF